MGIELVKLIAARLGSLSGNAYKVLVYMAATALDVPNAKGQPARLYFGGWEPLALALGYKGSSTYAKKAVFRALHELAARNLITGLEDHPRTGTRQTYRLELTVASLADWGSKSDPQRDPKSDPQQGVTFSPTGGRKVTPLGQRQDVSEDSSQDPTPHPSLEPHRFAREATHQSEVKSG